VAFGHVGLEWSDHVVIDERFFRPAEVELLVGDASRAREILDWQATTPFVDLVTMMVEADLDNVARQQRNLA
jgi:GDPmannose 4,6-dehydratase